MLYRVLSIALNTYRESVRARILLGLAGVAFAMAFASLVIGAFSLHNAPRVVSDLGAASISLFGIAVAIVLSGTSLYRELEQKTLFPILARPIRRGEYLVGKFLGTLLTLAVFMAADAGLVLFLSAALAGRPLVQVVGVGAAWLVSLGVVAWRWPRGRTYSPIPWAWLALVAGVFLSSVAPVERRVVLGASLLSFLEVAIIAAWAMLFSSFSTPFLSALLTVGMVVLGRNADTLTKFSVKQYGPVLHGWGKAMSTIVPNLHAFVPPRPLFTGEVASEALGPYLLMALITSVGWSVGLLAVASVIFKKRDFL